MLLSVIIVSYEVKYFLEQCLFSVSKAVEKLENDYGKGLAEVIVVDNASKDETIDYLESRFTSVKFIGYQKNFGFAKANNLGLKRVSGEHILFLNPDTILTENIFVDCISFFQSHPTVGAIGVRMIDGSGRFLPESKRGFPTAWRSFCKLSGLSAIFPTSQTFAGYNLGHLKELDVLPIDALAGAYMMVRKEVLDKVGMFDERFFMYAEDIDLSKRIREAGFDNYYLGNKTILHFKGESTRKDQQYVNRFYEAMRLYVEKHYTGIGSRTYVGIMKLGINIRSMFAKAKLQRSERSNDQLYSAHFIGDEGSSRVLKTKVKEIKEEISSDTLIFCEGSEYSFATIIEEIQKLPERKRAMVHASGSLSVVGSTDKGKQGNTIALISG